MEEREDGWGGNAPTRPDSVDASALSDLHNEADVGIVVVIPPTRHLHKLVRHSDVLSVHSHVLRWHQHAIRAYYPPIRGHARRLRLQISVMEIWSTLN